MIKQPTMFIKQVPNGYFGEYFCLIKSAMIYLEAPPIPLPTKTRSMFLMDIIVRNIS